MNNTREENDKWYRESHTVYRCNSFFFRFCSTKRHDYYCLPFSHCNCNSSPVSLMMSHTLQLLFALFFPSGPLSSRENRQINFLSPPFSLAEWGTETAVELELFLPSFLFWYFVSEFSAPGNAGTCKGLQEESMMMCSPRNRLLNFLSQNQFLIPSSGPGNF